MYSTCTFLWKTQQCRVASNVMAMRGFFREELERKKRMNERRRMRVEEGDTFTLFSFMILNWIVLITNLAWFNLQLFCVHASCVIRRATDSRTRNRISCSKWNFYAHQQKLKHKRKLKREKERQRGRCHQSKQWWPSWMVWWYLAEKWPNVNFQLEVDKQIIILVRGRVWELAWHKASAINVD